MSTSPGGVQYPNGMLAIVTFGSGLQESQKQGTSEVDGASLWFMISPR